MDVDLAPIFFVLMISSTAVQSRIQKGPTNALKKVGDSVTLECVTNSKNCDGVEWTKMEGAQTPLTVYTNGIILNGFRERYSVNSTGGCSLTITQLNISDSGKFSCKTLTVDSSEITRSSVLVVISVTEECLSNVTNNALNQNDGYSFSTVIKVPAKSVEPSNVILSFQNKIFDETETTDDTQSLTVKTTLTGIARKENIASRVCRASFLSSTADHFDRSTASLDVCTTQQLIVSYSVENIAVSPPGPYYKDSRVTCRADGHPYPTFKWTNLKSGTVVDNDTLVLADQAGYACTATNTVKGKPKSLSLNITIEVDWPHKQGTGCGPGCIGGIVVGVIVVIGVTVVIVFIVFKRRTS